MGLAADYHMAQRAPWCSHTPPPPLAGTPPQLSSLVVLEHKGSQLAAASLSAVAAALKLPGSLAVSVLVMGAGHEAAAVASQAARIRGVSRVLLASHDALAHQPPEPCAALLAAAVKARQSPSGAGLTHVVAPSTTFGKALLPRAAALLDVQPVSDVIAIQDGDTFVRPIYAGTHVLRGQLGRQMRPVALTCAYMLRPLTIAPLPSSSCAVTAAYRGVGGGMGPQGTPSLRSSAQRWGCAC